MPQYDDISMLPPKYQEQVRRKLAERDSPIRPLGGGHLPPAGEGSGRRNAEPIFSGKSREEAVKKKYRNQEMTVEGIRFDSKKEARRFIELREMEQCGEISDLRLQVNFTLIEGYTRPNGERVRPEVYRADFTYYRRDGAGLYTIYIVEDVKSKGTRTEKYKIKKKQMLEKFHLEITEV